MAGMVQFLALPNGYVGREHDDAVYVLASHSLSEGGYHFSVIPGRPAITIATPGFPALLLPVTFLFPDSLVAYQIYSWLILAACNFLVWRWLKKRHPPAAALGAMLLFALNPLVLSRAGVVMPEPAYLIGSLLVLLMWEEDSSPWAVGAGLLVCYLIRPAAVTLWAAVWAAYALRGRFQACLKSMAVPLAGFLAWAFWCHGKGGVQEWLELDLLWSGKGLPLLEKVVAANASSLAACWGATCLPLKAASGPLAPVAGLLLLAAAAAGYRRTSLLRRPADASDLYLLASLGMHLLWPWWYDRYLLPLLPFLLSKLVQGFQETAGPSWKKWGGTALAVFIPYQFLVQGRALIREDGGSPGMKNVYAWIENNTSIEDTFTSPFYGRDILYTGRVFFPLPLGDSPSDFRSGLLSRRIRYILWPELGNLGFSSSADSPVVRSMEEVENFLKDSSAFRLVYLDPENRTRIYELGMDKKTKPRPPS